MPKVANVNLEPYTMIYPVIMCGGSGTRLWPISRTERPKQFVSLIGEQTLFQAALDRVQGLEGVGRLIVVSGAAQASWIAAQIPDGTDVQVLLEPEGRDSAAAIAAASLAISETDPSGVAIVLASDHHVPDADAFRNALRLAVGEAKEGRIVTLGISPHEPSEAYGYIQPSEPGQGVSAIAAFVEKPDGRTAKRYIEDGYLWNSGNFIARADVLIEELRAHAPDVLEVVRSAVADRHYAPHGETLAESFRACRKVSIDYAVMEPTERASVVRAEVAWTDLGAWDAVYQALPKDADGNAAVGRVLVEGCRNTLTFNRTDRLCVVHGLDGASVVLDGDAVLVSTLDLSQDVKRLVERVKEHTEAEPAGDPFDIARAAMDLRHWLEHEALPLWWTHGFDHDAGVWREELTQDARPTETPARARVQGRQTFVYALAGRMGWAGPSKQIVEAGLAAIKRYSTRPDLMTTLVGKDGAVLDDRVLLYDQTFPILALAAGNSLMSGAEQRALLHLDAIEARFARTGLGFVEGDDHPYQSNAHMHLLEACLEWSEQGESSRWKDLSARIVELACDCFADATTLDGRIFLREYFDENWLPARGEDGRKVEPGHQFEWSWLLSRWARNEDDERARRIAAGLYEAGVLSLDTQRDVAVDLMELDESVDEFRPVTTQARLWPQTERLKAALILVEQAGQDGREEEFRTRLADAHRAHRAMVSYLATPVPGLWHDKSIAELGSRFVDEPAPASTFYHIATAVAQMTQTASVLSKLRSNEQADKA